VTDGSKVPGFDSRPNLIADPFAPGGSCLQTRTAECWFNPAAFQLACDKQLNPDGTCPGNLLAGNEGRNILRGPSYNNLDFALIKSFTLTERTRLQFRTEFFNLTNTPHFALPANALTDRQAGMLTHTRNSTNYGSTATSYGNRMIQFALKFEF